MWLVVLGRGTFATMGKRFPAGVHEVTDEAILDRVRLSGKFGTKLILCDEHPTVVTDDPSAPLTVDDIKTGTRGDVQLPQAEPELELDEDAGDDEAHACPFCPQVFPGNDRMERHIEFHHGIKAAIAAEVEVEPEPEPLPWEHEDRDETAVNSL